MHSFKDHLYNYGENITERQNRRTGIINLKKDSKSNQKAPRNGGSIEESCINEGVCGGNNQPKTVLLDDSTMNVDNSGFVDTLAAAISGGHANSQGKTDSSTKAS